MSLEGKILILLWFLWVICGDTSTAVLSVFSNVCWMPQGFTCSITTVIVPFTPCIWVGFYQQLPHLWHLLQGSLSLMEYAGLFGAGGSGLGDQGAAASGRWEEQDRSVWLFELTHTLVFPLSPALGHLHPPEESKNVFCNREGSKFHAKLVAGDINHFVYELKNYNHTRISLLTYVLGRLKPACLTPNFPLKNKMVEFGQGGWAALMSVRYQGPFLAADTAARMPSSISLKGAQRKEMEWWDLKQSGQNSRPASRQPWPWLLLNWLKANGLLTFVFSFLGPIYVLLSCVSLRILFKCLRACGCWGCSHMGKSCSA